MGKTPGKWIKSLLRKKTSKSKLSKGNDISLAPADGFRSVVVQELSEAAKLPNEGFVSTQAQGENNTAGVGYSGLEDDPERIRHERAATKVQAAFRGYQARREFQTPKSIIRLQALIRGHLVRRQAIDMLCCVWAIVRFQALARGKKVRRSALGIKVQNACNQGKDQGAFCSDSSGKCTSIMDEKLIKNAFAQKLLASSSVTVPLSLRYCPGEDNSSWVWLERWTRSHFWGSHSQQNKSANHDTLKKMPTKQGRAKRSFRNPSRTVLVSKGSEKPTCKPRKVSGHPAASVQKHPEIEVEKVNQSSKTTFDSTKEVRKRLDVGGKTKRSLRRSLVVATPEVPLGTDDSAMTVTKVSDAHISAEPPSMDDHTSALQKTHDLVMQPLGSDAKVDTEEANKQVNLMHGNDECYDLGMQPVGTNRKVDDSHGEIRQLNHGEYHSSNEDQKLNERRASLPSNVEHQENGSTAKGPSYMAPTESARAKLRGQGSPRFSQDAIENIAITRRHSLPSSTNGKLTSMSPRAQKLVHSAGKGLVRGDKSLSSSRDGTVSDKMMKPEWRR